MKRIVATIVAGTLALATPAFARDWTRQTLPGVPMSVETPVPLTEAKQGNLGPNRVWMGNTPDKAFGYGATAAHMPQLAEYPPETIADEMVKVFSGGWTIVSRRNVEIPGGAGVELLATMRNGDLNRIRVIALDGWVYSVGVTASPDQKDQLMSAEVERYLASAVFEGK